MIRIPFKMPARDITLTGTGGEPQKEAPLLFRLRLLYAGTGGIAAEESRLFDGSQPLHIGRSGAGPADGKWVRIDDERVSREHAVLRAVDDFLLVEDLKSKNGSSVNGQALAPGERRPLRDGDLLRVGDSFLLLRREVVSLNDVAIPSLLGVSLAARELRAAIVRVTPSERPVLIEGETGTGKEVVAQAIHALSQRRGRLIAINCAAIPATLAEAQLFGVRRGAFTGAIDQPGHFLDAHEGTLFLDEVGELSIDLQPKLLRTLETREVTPVGTTRTVPCDARIVAATNRNLEDAVARRHFRADLYARLSGSILRTPPLRERREDILLLAQHFAGGGFRPSPRLVAAMLGYDWPLNIRELKNLIGRIQDAENESVLVRELSARKLATPAAASAEAPPARPAPAAFAPAPAAPSSPSVAVDELRAEWAKGDPIPTRAKVIALLTQHRGSLHAIERAFGASRRQFRRWAEEKYGLDLASFRAAGSPPEEEEGDG